MAICKVKKRIYFVFIITVLIVSIISVVLFNWGGVFFSQFESIVNYNLRLPQPQKIVKVYHHDIAYSIYKYNNKKFDKVMEMDIWREIDEEAAEFINGRVIEFEAGIDKRKYENPFIRNPIEISDDSMYYFRRKPSHAFILLILDKATYTVYVLLHNYT